MKKEFCIMPPDPVYATERREGLVRHEIFFGAYRQKSIEKGLVVFLTPDMHNGEHGIHFDSEFNHWLKHKGQVVAMKHYGLTEEEFIKMFGRSYLHDNTLEDE